MIFLLRPEEAEKCALRDLRRSEARPVHSKSVSVYPNQNFEHLIWAGPRLGTPSRQAGRKQVRKARGHGSGGLHGVVELFGRVLTKVVLLVNCPCVLELAALLKSPAATARASGQVGKCKCLSICPKFFGSLTTSHRPTLPPCPSHSIFLAVENQLSRYHLPSRTIYPKGPSSYPACTPAHPHTGSLARSPYPPYPHLVFLNRTTHPKKTPFFLICRERI